ncbi:alpha/beta hydrolase [Paenarthrobacter nicotinovorans]|uniref:alpha/beta hydrolase n=1 Tax=Paenarthrobacter nicotinovorans TaxID=29320 RepID=UPI0037480EBF
MGNPRFAAEFGDVRALYPVVDLADLQRARRDDAEMCAQLLTEDLPALDPHRVTVTTESLTDPETGRAFAVRVYRPVQLRGTSGALVFAHGGAFCLGDLQTDHLRCLLYSQKAGIIVVSVDYALAPEHPFPAGLRDCWQTLQWVEDNHQSLGVDPSRIGVGGESAGGALAAALAQMDRDSGTNRLACQMLLFPVLDHRQVTGSILAGDSTPAWNSTQTVAMWRYYLETSRNDIEPNGTPAPKGTAVSAYASPWAAGNLAHLPPALLVTADIDPLRDEGIDYGRRMMQDGVAVDMHNYTGTFHVFDLASPTSRVSQRTLHDQIAFLVDHLRTDPWPTETAVAPS